MEQVQQSQTDPKSFHVNSSVVIVFLFYLISLFYSQRGKTTLQQQSKLFFPLNRVGYMDQSTPSYFSFARFTVRLLMNKSFQIVSLIVFFDLPLPRIIGLSSIWSILHTRASKSLLYIWSNHLRRVSTNCFYDRWEKTTLFIFIFLNMDLIKEFTKELRIIS